MKKHKLTISVKKPSKDVVTCKVMQRNSKYLEKAIKESDEKTTIIIPGSTVDGIKIQETTGGMEDE